MMSRGVLDQTGDVSRTDLNRFSRLYEFPDFVKNAKAQDTLSPPRELRSTAFADCRRREFPIHTKAATWMSYLYFLEKCSNLHPTTSGMIRERLNQAAAQWGVSSEVKHLQEKHAELQKGHLADSDYMLVWASEDGTKERLYPLRNSMEVKVASEWFMAHRDHWGYDDRRTMASRLLEKANAFGVAFPDETDTALEQQVGRGTYVPKQAADHIRNRVRAAPQQVPHAILDGMTKLAEAVESNPHLATCSESIQGMCRTVSQFDSDITKLAGNYSALLPRPENIFCGAAFKVAEAALEDSVQLATGRVYHRDEMAKVALSDLRDVLGDDLAGEMASGLSVDPEKLADIAPTLPKPDAELLDRVMDDNNVRPMFKAAQAIERPSHETLLALRKLCDTANQG